MAMSEWGGGRNQHKKPLYIVLFTCLQAVSRQRGAFSKQKPSNNLKKKKMSWFKKCAEIGERH